MPRGLLVPLALWLAWLLAGCAIDPEANRYQQGAPDASAPRMGAVTQLQTDARDALDGATPSRAIEYLQRAIRIEPRNADSWHLLADAWRMAGDAERCMQMARRAASYGRGDAAFERDNQRLLDNCGVR